MKKALIVQGGWDGHEPVPVSNRFAGILKNNGFETEISDTLEAYADLDKLMALDLIVSCWTMGKLDKELGINVCKAVGAGVGLAGCHGGMCDAFRESTNWQFMVGGQWVSHPGGGDVEYTVNISRGSSPIVDGIEDFPVCSEQYYVHIDPCIEVLATTRFPHPDIPYYHISNKPVDVPVCWTKMWGLGRVFYLSLGHHDDVFDKSPSGQILMERGMLWAADGRRIVREQGLTTERFESQKQMY